MSSDLENFDLSDNSLKGQNKNKNKNKNKPSPISASPKNDNNQTYEIPPRPNTPPGLSKNKAKKWRKNWEYQQKQKQKKFQQNNNKNKNKNKQKKKDKKSPKNIKNINQSSPKPKSSTISQKNTISIPLNKKNQKKNQKNQKNPNNNTTPNKNRGTTGRVLPQYDNPHTKKKSRKQALVTRIPIDINKQISIFAHLPQNEKYLFYISPKIKSMIHPVILRAGLYYADGTSWGANTRCITMLNGFAAVVKDFKCPSNKSFSREILQHLNPCIQFLNDCRPQSVSMANTIRWLKAAISKIAAESDEIDDDNNGNSNGNGSGSGNDNDNVSVSVSGGSGMDLLNDDDDMPGGSGSGIGGVDGIKRSASMNNEDEQRHKILKCISDFVLKIETADKMIEVELLDRICDGDVILTYARSYVVEKSLIAAYNEGKKFKVIIVDARPHLEGKCLLYALSQNCPNLDINYTLINSVSYVMSKKVNKVVLGASCIMSNGAIVSRCGTATVALIANHYHVPVIVCCETYKFSERVQIDSICSNELGDFDGLVKNGLDKPLKNKKNHSINNSLFDNYNASGSGSGSGSTTSKNRFTSTLYDDFDKNNDNKYDDNDDNTSDDDDNMDDDNPFHNKLLGNWRNIPKLKMLNLKYDTTPSSLITMIITELGVMPTTTAPVVIRECHKDRQLF